MARWGKRHARHGCVRHVQGMVPSTARARPFTVLCDARCGAMVGPSRSRGAPIDSKGMSFRPDPPCPMRGMHMSFVAKGCLEWTVKDMFICALDGAHAPHGCVPSGQGPCPSVAIGYSLRAEAWCRSTAFGSPHRTNEDPGSTGRRWASCIAGGTREARGQHSSRSRRCPPVGNGRIPMAGRTSPSMTKPAPLRRRSGFGPPLRAADGAHGRPPGPPCRFLKKSARRGSQKRKRLGLTE